MCFALWFLLGVMDKRGQRLRWRFTCDDRSCSVVRCKVNEKNGNSSEKLDCLWHLDILEITIGSQSRENVEILSMQSKHCETVIIIGTIDSSERVRGVSAARFMFLPQIFFAASKCGFRYAVCWDICCVLRRNSLASAFECIKCYEG